MDENFQEEKYIKRCLMYLNKELTLEQRTDFEIDLLIDDQLQIVYQRYRTLWRVYPMNTQLIDQYTSKAIKIHKKKRSLSYTVLGWACGLLLLISLNIVFWSSFKSTEDTHTYEYTNTKGHRSTVFLTDGSKVILNGDSKIKYRLENTVRKVYLQGEAFFEVVHMSDKKFIVEHNNLQVEVLGTKFSVNTQNTIKEVLLLSGSVLARFNNNEQLYLKPNEKLLYNSATGEVAREKRDASIELQWRNNILVFKNEPLQDALIRIQQFYGCKFSVKNTALLQARITGTFEQQTISEFVKSLSFVTNCNISLEGSVYIIN